MLAVERCGWLGGTMNTSSWRAERQAEVASEWGVYDLCGRTDSAVPFVERLTTLLNISVWNQQCIADALNVVAAMSSVCTSVANYVSSVVRGCKPELSLDGRLGVRGTTKE